MKMTNTEAAAAIVDAAIDMLRGGTALQADAFSERVLDLLNEISPPRNVSEGAARSDGTVRKVHYGSGRQPWDDFVDLGWAPEFAAGCVVRYLRRDKDIEHSQESARWYYARLVELADGTHASMRPRASQRLVELRQLLNSDELRVAEGLS